LRNAAAEKRNWKRSAAEAEGVGSFFRIELPRLDEFSAKKTPNPSQNATKTTILDKRHAAC
jgi:hypothetical protein